MHCEEFRNGCKKYVIEEYRPRFDDEHHSDWVSHMANCEDCADSYLKAIIEKNGGSVTGYPCVHVAFHSMHDCKEHESAWDCPDTALIYSEGLFGIPVRDGGESYIQINNCPWCGVGLYKK